LASFLATKDHFSSNWASVVRGGKGDQLVVGRLGMNADLEGVAGHSVAVDPHEPLGLADATAVFDVLQHGRGLVRWEWKSGVPLRSENRSPQERHRRKRIGGESLP
jgi:hypothetical protein